MGFFFRVIFIIMQLINCLDLMVICINLACLMTLNDFLFVARAPPE